MTTPLEKLPTTQAGPLWAKIGIRHHHGFVVPLFSLHSKHSCGIGEFPDLIRLLPWCRLAGIDVIQLLPINDPGQDTSPYCALSAFALNPLYIGLDLLPNANQNPELKRQIQELQQLNKTQRVDYPSVQKGKERFFREYYAQYGKSLIESPNFQYFKDINHAWLTKYAQFKALKIKYGWSSWESWPHEVAIDDQIQAEMNYHIFLQYLCFNQYQAVKQAAQEAGIFIKGDIPILINSESADVWSNPELFLLEYAAGAPPDMYSQEGQKWGFPLYNWETHAATNYQWWIDRLQTAQKGYHIYRIDHVVGFFRIWAMHLDQLAKDGQFIPSNENEWIPHGKILMEMMLKNCEMLPIGEDLGTIPPPVRVCLRELGICGTKVMRWERRWNEDKGYIAAQDYIPESMTTVSTHDSETLAQWWKDFPDESGLFAKTFGIEYTPELSTQQRYQVLKISHHTSSLFHINLLAEYLAMIPGYTWDHLEDERINLPGIISDKNWSYRFRPPLEEVVSNVNLLHLLREVIS